MVTPEEWEELAVSVRRADKAVQWWIGDLYNAQRWGDKGKEMERLGFNPKTAARYGVVAKKFPPGTRKNNLPFTHHMAVYKHEDAQELLKEAEKDALSVKDLKQRLKQRRSCVDQRAANPSRKHFSPQAHAEAEPRSEVPDPGDAPASGDDEGIDATASAERPKAPSAGCLTGSAPQTSTQPSETESSRQSRSKKESKDDRASIPAERRQAVLYASSLLKQLAEIHDAQAVLDALAEAGLGDLLSASAAQTINRPSPEEHNRHTTGQQEAA